MTDKEYHKMTEVELKGRRVKVLALIENGITSIPAGTILTIKAKRSGFQLAGERCPHCGIQPFISRVEPRFVELLP